jgi:hypothetical protein
MPTTNRPLIAASSVQHTHRIQYMYFDVITDVEQGATVFDEKYL